MFLSAIHPAKPSVYNNWTVIVWLILGLMFSPLSRSSEGTTDPGLVEVISSLITSNRHPYLLHNDIYDQHEDIQALYQLNSYQLVWLKNGALDSQVDDVLALLANAEENGLNAQNYDESYLARKWLQIKAGQDKSPQALALYDTALNIALLRYLSDLHYGQIKAHNVKLGADIILEQVSLAGLIVEAAAQKKPSELVAKVEPVLPVYRHLKEALSRYRQLARTNNFHQFSFIQTLRPGQHDSQMVFLRELLTALGDMPESAETDAKNGKLYDASLVNGVKNFQLRHGLGGDGVIGKSTVAALNMPLADRIRQIELSMERFRWLPRVKEGSLIIVNIPAFQLWAYDSIGMETVPPLNMKVIVGKSLNKQTPVFMANMHFLQFRPYWNVPRSIVKEELLPKLRLNWSYLAGQNMELVNNFGPNATVMAVNDETINLLSRGLLKVRQRPGRLNALGSVKFMFPNDYNVYLHDTPTQNLFKRTRRDFSHGCVRVEDPEALAEFVLKSKDGWDRQRISKAMHRDNPRYVQLDNPIPVIIFYTTAMATADQVLFFEDIYGLDNPLVQALSRPVQKKTADTVVLTE
ncbi:L,D-transpeptidase family protein [Methylobacter luteus]|uniref:L,D-transpeptidase family protein n=1 Tax=Methylobacter luteus TaxID=415 RepID=UPI0004098402|nr:L,D-transpeptidase family protein [Methylobacter luteus]